MDTGFAAAVAFPRGRFMFRNALGARKPPADMCHSSENLRGTLMRCSNIGHFLTTFWRKNVN
jgi:hypothetical protein